MNDVAVADRVPMIGVGLDGRSREERFLAWKDNVTPLFEVDPDAPLQESPVETWMRTYHFGSTLFSRASSLPQRVRRSRRQVSRSGVDHFVLLGSREGRTCGEFGRNALDVRAGDLFLMDMSQTIQVRVEAFDCRFLVMPRGLIEQHVRQPERLHGKLLPRESVAARLLNEHLDGLWQACGSVTVREADTLGQGLAGLAAAYFSGLPLPQESPEVETATATAIRRYIDQHFSEPDLTPEGLAHRFHVLRARLYRLFKPWGGVCEYIRERRLAWAYRELSAPSGAPRRVIDVALAAGFASEAHFSRLFRQTFGITPREARHEMPGALPPGIGHCSADGPSVQEWLRRLGR